MKIRINPLAVACLALLAVKPAAFPQTSAPLVQLSIPAVDTSGTAIANGTVYISWPPFLDNAGTLHSGNTKTIPITNGRINVALAASDNAGFVYNVLVQRGDGTNSSAFKWRVPAAGASTMGDLAQAVPTHDNAIDLNVSDMTCGRPVDGVLRRMPAPGGEAMQICLSSYSTFWRSLGAALDSAAKTSIVRVRIFGDSLSQCWGASGNSVSNCPGIGPAAHANLWAEQLRSWLNSQYPSHGSGVIPFVPGAASWGGLNSASGSNGEYNLNAGNAGYYPATVPNQITSGNTQGAGLQLGQGQSISSIVDHAGNGLTVYYTTFTFGTNNTSGSSGGFSLAVDGTTVGTGIGAGVSTALAAQANSFAIPSASNHRATLTCNSDACYVYGLEWTKGATGVSVDNFAVASCRAECFASSDKLTMPGLALSPNSFDIVMLGTNDFLHGNLNDYKANIASFLSLEKAAGVRAVLVISEPWSAATPQTAGNSQADFFAAAQGAAAAAGVDYLSLTASAPFLATATESSFLEDGIHLNDAGQAAIWSVSNAYLANTTYHWYPITLGAAISQ